MEVIGILSLIFGIIGLLSSVQYIGILPCVVGIVLGIVGLTDFLSDKKFATAGLLISILGAIVSVYVYVSDIDSGRLVVIHNNGKSQSVDVASKTSDSSAQIYKTTTESKVTEVSKQEEKAESLPEKNEEKETKQSSNNKSDNVLYQDDNIVITYQGISENYFGYDFDLLVENKTNRTLTVQVREMSINGFMVNMPACSIEIAPGKKARDGITIMLDDAENTPMNSVKTAEAKFAIIDWDDYDFDYETQSVIIQ